MESGCQARAGKAGYGWASDTSIHPAVVPETGLDAISPTTTTSVLFSSQIFSVYNTEFSWLTNDPYFYNLNSRCRLLYGIGLFILPFLSSRFFLFLSILFVS